MIVKYEISRKQFFNNLKVILECKREVGLRT